MNKIHVLLVEDEFIPAIYLQKKLVEFGYRVSGPIASGEEAVKLAIQEQPDIILMDIHLAGDLDGIEAANEISTVYTVPVVFMTGYPDRLTIERATQIKPAHYLIKPAHPNQIRAAIDKALTGNETEK